MKNDKTALFETMPVGKALMTMAIPTIVSQLITMIYNMADTFFIGLSNDPYKVAAASIVGVLFFMLNALSNLFGVGGGSLLSRLLGEKREDDAKRVGVFSFYGSLFIASVYAFVCFLFTRPLARLLGASDNTVDYAANYLFWAVVVGAIPSTLNLTMSHLLRSAGYSRESGIGLAVGGISNIILDPLFMFVILPAGNEVTGAAVATLFSNVISLGYFLFVYRKLQGKTVLSISPRFIRLDKSLIFGILAIGLPSALTSLLANTTSIVKNNLCSSYGDIEMAAYGIVIKADMLPLNIGMGLCQGMMPLVAYNYAAKNYSRMRSFTRAAQISGMATACFFIVLFEVFAPQIIWLFIRDDATIGYGTNFLRIACLATPFMISNFQKIYCLQAMGKGRATMLHAVVRELVFYIPFMFLLDALFGQNGLAAALVVGEACGAVFALYLLNRVVNSAKKKAS